MPLRAANIFCSAAVRAEIRAIDRLKLAHAVKEQKLSEAQNIAEIVLDAEAKIGELLKGIPKTTNNNPDGKNQYQIGQKSSTALLTTPKQQAKETLDISDDQAKRFMKLAENKPMVEQAKAEAREKGEIVTRQFGFISAGLEKMKSRHEKTYMSEPRTCKTETLENAGIDRRRAVEAEKLAAIPENEFAEIIAEKRESEELSKAAVMKAADRERREQKKAEIRAGNFQRWQVRRINAPISLGIILLYRF